MSHRNLSLRLKAIIACLSATVLIVLVVVSFEISVSGTVENARLEITQTSEAMYKSSTLAQNLKQVQIDIIQVQQWLTDISATRGLDGLNDGFDQAANFAERFAADAEKAGKLAAELDADELGRAIDQVKAAFPAFYAMGRKMAQSYVDEGPQGGNKTMGEFDTTAEKIYGGVDEMLALMETVKADISARTEASRVHLSDAVALQSKGNLAVAGLVALFLLLACIALFRAS